MLQYNCPPLAGCFVTSLFYYLYFWTNSVRVIKFRDGCFNQLRVFVLMCVLSQCVVSLVIHSSTYLFSCCVQHLLKHDLFVSRPTTQWGVAVFKGWWQEVITWTLTLLHAPHVELLYYPPGGSWWNDIFIVWHFSNVGLTFTVCLW